MTPQAFLEQLRRAVEPPTRADRRAVARQQFGVCGICQVPLSQHFNRRNEFVPCHAPHGTEPTPPASSAEISEGNRNRRAA